MPSDKLRGEPQSFHQAGLREHGIAQLDRNILRSGICREQRVVRDRGLTDLPVRSEPPAP